MGKGTNYSGHPVLSQLTKLMDRQKINILASKSGANHYTKHLDGYSHLVVMLYAVLSNLRSLREVCLGFAANATRMNHLGIDHMICRSTLSDANKRRKSSFFGSIYRSLYERYAPLLSDSISKKERTTKLYVMDSTTISLFSQILRGTGRNPNNGKKKGGIKAHTIINENIDLPLFADYTAGIVHDRKLMDRIFDLPYGSFVAFDMGYTDYLKWKQLDEAGYKFVCRLKDNAKFKIIEQRQCPEKNIIADQIIEFTYDKNVERALTEEEMSHRRGRRPKSGVVTVKERVHGTFRCRRILRRTDDEKGMVEFVTNVLDIEEMSAEQVCETYRRRWTIESLYKKLKQNFPLKYFLGDNVNAIEIQIWVTLIAYLLLRVMQVKSMSKLAFSNIVMLTRVILGAYVDLITLLNCPKQDWNLLEQQRALWNKSQNIRQLDLFDDR